jgi:hypothetical protein
MAMAITQGYRVTSGGSKRRLRSVFVRPKDRIATNATTPVFSTILKLSFDKPVAGNRSEQ